MKHCGAPVAAALAFFALAALPACRIIPMKSDKTTAIDASRSSFDPAKFIETNWQPRVVPYFATKAVELRTVLDGIAADYAGTAKSYGVRHGDQNGPVGFAVKGSGKVASVDTQARAGTMVLEVATAAGSRQVTLRIGPVVFGDAVRDSLAFLHFQDFTNQIEYAQASRALNARAMETIKPDLPKISVGQTVGFVGGMTTSSAADAVSITPVQLLPGSAP